MDNVLLPVNPHGVDLRWKVIALLGAPVDLGHVSAVFRPRPAVGLFRGFGSDPEKSFVPQFMDTSKTFHQRAIAALAQAELEPTGGQRLPVLVRLLPTGSQRGRLNLTVHWYPPHIVCLTVTVSDLEDGEALTLDQVHKLQLLTERSAAGVVVASALHQISASSESPRETRLLKRYSALTLRLPWAGATFSSTVEHHHPELVGMLIRAPEPRAMRDELVANVWEKNDALNWKSTQEHLLLNKQGIVNVRPDGNVRVIHETKRILDLAEIALAWDAFFEDEPALREEYPLYADFLLLRARDWILAPSTLLHRTVTYRLAFEALLASLALPARLEALLRVREAPDDDRTRLLERFARSWWDDPSFFQVLDGAVHAAEGSGLAFIEDPLMRDLLARDLREARRARVARNFKSTMVLAGSVIEAALFAILERYGPPDSRRGKKGLRQLYEDAVKHGLLQQTEDVRGLIETIATFRNLIHPGLEVRASMTPNQQRADISLSAMELVLQGIEHAWKDRVQKR